MSIARASRARLSTPRVSGRPDWTFDRGFEGLAASRTTWASLEASGACAFDAYDLHVACAEAAGSDTIVVARLHRGTSDTILPLRIVRRLGVREALSLGAPIMQYAACLGSPLSGDDLQDLVRLLRARFGVDLLRLRKVRCVSPLAPGLVDAGATPSEATFAPFIDLAAFGSYEAYEASLTNASRRTRRQRLRRLEQEVGPVRFEVLRGVEADEALSLALRWKRGWLDAASLSSPVLDGGVWEKALLACARCDGARVGVLRAGSRPAAIELGFVGGGEYLSYLGAFDPDLSRYGVGSEQIARSIAWCFGQGVKRYDFLAPNDAYKLVWTRDLTRSRVADYSLTANLRGRVFSTVHSRGRVLAKQAFLTMPKPIQSAAHRLGLTRDLDGAVRWGGTGLTLATISATVVACD
jgi:CelD/BcsL family acetyltransferase involved in cellulose biosynthesis